MSRELLCINPDKACFEIFPALREAGWQPRPTYRADEVRSLVETQGVSVGVCQIGPETASTQLAFLPEIAASHQAEWIALLPPAALETPGLRRIVADYFFDFHTLPLDLGRMLTTLGHAYGMARLKRADGVQLHVSSEEEMVGCSEQMQSLFRAIRKVAATEAPVLIAGESGTGKELTARAIHERSARAKGPLTIINCGAIPPNLIQSELFGYEKGAFTGATQRKIGRIEQASGGTLFLDEIGDLPLDLQINLLRFLQERQIDRIGGTEPVPVDVRVIAATNVELEKAVAEGRFRSDLYHRLNVLSLSVPSLRERAGDIPLLARYFFDHFDTERRRSLRGFSREALEAMARYDWPGNVRELINRVRRAMVMCEGRLIRPHDLGLAPIETRIMSLAEARERAERDAIRDALARHAQNHLRAARDLGVSRATLYRLLGKHGFDVPSAPAA